MEIFLEIIKYVLPAAIVFFTAFYIIRQFINDERERRIIETESRDKQKLLEMKMANQKVINPIRLQAYERVVLLLERISPGSLIMRNSRTGMSAFQLQIALVQNIRDEFEHNLSQQLYISTNAWDLVRSAKEEMIRVVNTAATKCNDNSTAAELAQIIFQLNLEDKPAVASALEYLKNEARQLF